VKKVQVLREKELQKLEGAPAGYIGRRRTKGTWGGGGRQGERARRFARVQVASELRPRQDDQVGLDLMGLNQMGLKYDHAFQPGASDEAAAGQLLSLSLSDGSDR